MNDARLHVAPSADQLMRDAADAIVALARAAIAARGRFSIALSGGSTPRALYALLASATYAGQIDWPRAHVFWGDERCVPPDDPRSNYGMSHAALLAHVPVPEDQIHRITGEAPPDAAAHAYETLIHRVLTPADGGETFDLVLLGLGEDGHTASIFPHSPAVSEQHRWAVATLAPRFDTQRVTLTPPCINTARTVVFLVSGEGKAAMVQRVLRGPVDPAAVPAQAVRPTSGDLRWMMDAAAAAHVA